MKRYLVIGILWLAGIGAPTVQAQERPGWSGKNERLDDSRIEMQRLSLVIEQMVKANEISAELGEHVRTLLMQQREMSQLFSRYGLLDPESLQSKIAQIQEVTQLRTFLFFTESQKARWEEWEARIIARPVSGRLVIYDNPPGYTRRR